MDYDTTIYYYNTCQLHYKIRCAKSHQKSYACTGKGKAENLKLQILTITHTIILCHRMFKKCNSHCSWTNLLMHKLNVCMGVTCVLVHVWVWIGVGPHTLSCSHHVPFATDVCLCVCVFVCVCVCVCGGGMNVGSSGDCKVTWGLLARFQKLAMKFIVM